MPISCLQGDGNEYRARLLDGELFIAPGRKGARATYPCTFQTSRTEHTALCVSRVRPWHGDNFVLQVQPSGPEGCGDGPVSDSIRARPLFLNVAGTLDDWRNNVGRFCSGNSMADPWRCLARSPVPVLSLVQAEAGAFTSMGRPSTGKSKAPSGGRFGLGGRRAKWVCPIMAGDSERIGSRRHSSFIMTCACIWMNCRKWTRARRPVAYLLGNGSGKARMSATIGARKKLTWCMMFVSAGEVTLADHARTAEQTLRAARKSD